MGINQMKCDAVFSSYTNEIYIYSLITLVRHFSSVGLYYEILILSTVFFLWIFHRIIPLRTKVFAG